MASQKKLSLKENDRDLCKRKKERKKNPFCFNHMANFFYSVCILHFELFTKIMFLFRLLSEKLCCNIFISPIAANLKNNVL